HRTASNNLAPHKGQDLGNYVTVAPGNYAVVHTG
ncbi:hypothetical protein J2X68_001186, partial [Streptomyces sp. 3330]|nr:hypothetical protein [Streptomyces sp. 3330]